MLPDPRDPIGLCAGAAVHEVCCAGAAGGGLMPKEDAGVGFEKVLPAGGGGREKDELCDCPSVGRWPSDMFDMGALMLLLLKPELSCGVVAVVVAV